jgi:ferritin-like metal-binding protein YciE
MNEFLPAPDRINHLIWLGSPPRRVLRMARLAKFQDEGWPAGRPSAKKASGEKCDAIEGLIKEADGLMAKTSGTALNAGLLAACQAVEHYEIARYGSLREWAKDLGPSQAHKLLSEILDQEKATNNKLTNLAVTSINKKSATA